MTKHGNSMPHCVSSLVYIVLRSWDHNIRHSGTVSSCSNYKKYRQYYDVVQTQICIRRFTDHQPACLPVAEVWISLLSASPARQ